MASALWELSGEDELLKAYKKELILHGKTIEDMKPMIRITTSDTGAGGANIYPMLVAGKENTTINLGEPLRLGHRNGTKVSEFDNQLNMIYGKYQLATRKLMHFTRDGINSKIISLGATAGSSVTKKTDYLICGEKAGSKLTKAKELGVTILTEQQFLDMISA